MVKKRHSFLAPWSANLANIYTVRPFLYWIVTLCIFEDDDDDNDDDNDDDEEEDDDNDNDDDDEFSSD